MGDFLIISLKVFIAVLLIPVVIAASVGLISHLDLFPISYEHNFLLGAIAFLFMYFFVYQFYGVFEFGQRIIENMFRFLTPADRWLVYVIPFYLTANMLLFFAVKRLLGVHSSDDTFMFLAGFSFVLHVLMTARNLQDKERSAIKPSYYFVIVVSYILTTCFFVLLLDLVSKDFYFLDFVSDVLKRSKENYLMCFRKLI